MSLRELGRISQYSDNRIGSEYFVVESDEARSSEDAGGQQSKYQCLRHNLIFLFNNLPQAQLKICCPIVCDAFYMFILSLSGEQLPSFFRMRAVFARIRCSLRPLAL